MTMEDPLPDEQQRHNELSSRINQLLSQFRHLEAKCRAYGQRKNAPRVRTRARTRLGPEKIREMEEEAEAEDVERRRKLMEMHAQYWSAVNELGPIHARLAERHNRSVKILSPPFEILSLIFVACRAAYDEDESLRDVRPDIPVYETDIAITLHGVCQTFRRVVLDTPLVWATIGRRNISNLETYLQRSKNSMLRISFHSGQTVPDKVQSLIPHLHRLRSLSLSTSSPVNLNFLLKPLRSHCLPILTHLAVSYAVDGPRHEPFDEDLMFDGSDELMDAAVEEFDAFGKTILLCTSMPTLAKLHLIDTYLHPDCGVSTVDNLIVTMPADTYPVDWINERQLFVPFLENLVHLSINLDALSEHDDRIHFVKLQSLFVQPPTYILDDYANDDYEWDESHPLEHIDAPTLRSLIFLPESPTQRDGHGYTEGEAKMWTLRDHLRSVDPERFPLLSKLTLVAEPGEDAPEIIAHLDLPAVKEVCNASVPNLEDLTVVGCDAALTILSDSVSQGQMTLDTFLSIGAKDQSKEVECWRKLRTLTIVGDQTKHQLKLLQMMLEHRSRGGAPIRKLIKFGTIEDREDLARIEGIVGVVEIRGAETFEFPK